MSKDSPSKDPTIKNGVSKKLQGETQEASGCIYTREPRCSGIKKEKTILFVFAHPDDESYITGGTIAKYASDGVRIVLACLSHGEKGRKLGEVAGSKLPLGKIRKDELKTAAGHLGIAKIYLFDFPDGGIGKVPQKKLENKIIWVIRREKPEVVVTFHKNGITGHKDHIAVSLATKNAFYNSGKHEIKTGHRQPAHYSKKLYYWTMDESLAKILGSKYKGVRREKLTTIIDCKGFLKKRILAIKSHISQYKTEEFVRREKFRRIETECYIREFPPFALGREKESDLLE